ncbi:hypothetical protein AMECASPLE_026683 [Ameca splendens]|uniref:Uncharacterized protein n=1 Tax=Ameca splendens TaxID=208324 RepID=A0ABV0ZPU4_9TELE
MLKAGEELFQSFREPAAKLHFLPRPCSRREASQPNGGRACQAACAPAKRKNAQQVRVGLPAETANGSAHFCRRMEVPVCFSEMSNTTLRTRTRAACIPGRGKHPLFHCLVWPLLARILSLPSNRR